MVPPKEPEPALAAPGIGGPNSIEGPGVSGPRSARRSRNRSYSHVHLEIDLAPDPKPPTGVAPLERLAEWLSGKQMVEQGTLIVLAAATLHALSARRFRRVDTWEVSPGSWLPPPRPGEDPDAEEPVGYLLKALESDAGASVGTARSFSATLSDLSGGTVDVVVRRVHGGHGHAMSLDLRGNWTPAAVKDLTGALSERLPVIRSTMTKYQYA
ncbi:MAG: hypothetical protein L3K18_04980 [Thermoplasmata archaeon]|nr:hypothetical protein [Thermoplasmata archaeon]MCI4356481.1 hypothetical protein [Thermoplasmata archaeon]